MRKYFVIFTLILSSLTVLSQTGKVTGIIKDAETNETIPFANILIKGTSIGVVSDIDGKYELKLQPGKYDITYMFLGYEEVVKKGISIEAGQTITINISLATASFKLDDVVVTSTKVTNTEMAVMIEMRKSEQIVSGISSQQIKKSQDNDAAQVVRRIPGVTITDDRFIVVRGLANRYNNVLLNGVIAPSVEADSRSFSFDLIPSSMIDRMMVFKSGSPDIPGDFAGALVKIYTKNTVEENFNNVNFTMGIRSGTTFGDFNTAKKEPLDVIALGQINRAMPEGIAPNVADYNFQPQEQVNQAKLFDNNWSTSQTTAAPDVRFRYEMGKKFMVGEKLMTSINAISYSNTNLSQSVQRNRYRDYKEDGNSSNWFSYSDNRNVNNVRLGLVSNWSLKTNERNIYEFRNFITQTGGLETTVRNGINQVTDSEERNYSYRYESRFIYSGQLQGTHTLNGGRSEFVWIGGFTASNRQEPDWRRAQSRRPVGSEDDFQMVVQSSANAQNSSRFFSYLNERAFTGAADFEHIINPEKNFKIKTGVFTEYKYRTFQARTLSFVRSSSSLDPSVESQPLETIYGPDNMYMPSGLKLGENTKYTDYYAANNMLAAYYIGSSIKLKKLSLAGGLRLEYNFQQLETAQPSPTQNPVTAELLNLPLLPYLNASYGLTDRTLIRASFGMNVNRPEFRELAPFTYYNFDLTTDVVGNPNLKNATITNMDVRWEFYPTASEVINFGVFYKHFRNPIEFAILSGASNPVYVYNNADEAVAFGFEAEFRKNLSFISPSLERFSFLLNAALIRSQIDLGAANQERQARYRPLQGQSPYVINTGLYYNFKGTQVALLYNVAGRRIFLVGDVEFPTQWEIPRNMLDLTFSRALTEKTELKIGVTDILNAKYGVIEDGNQDGKIDNPDADKSIISTRFGQYVQIGFTYKF
jgi:TonB-dependent receptor